MRASRIVKSMSSTSSHWMSNSHGFYRKAEDVEVRFYGMVNAHIASKMIKNTEQLVFVSLKIKKERKKERKKRKNNKKR